MIVCEVYNLIILIM